MSTNQNSAPAVTQCQCEHAEHEPGGASHAYLRAPAGEQRAHYVGPICDECARAHLAEYLLTVLPASKCNHYGPSGQGCAGDVEYRMALSATGIPRAWCDQHWSERLDLEQGIRERYPEHPPADWSPDLAGEAWSEDDY